MIFKEVTEKFFNIVASRWPSTTAIDSILQKNETGRFLRIGTSFAGLVGKRSSISRLMSLLHLWIASTPSLSTWKIEGLGQLNLKPGDFWLWNSESSMRTWWRWPSTYFIQTPIYLTNIELFHFNQEYNMSSKYFCPPFIWQKLRNLVIYWILFLCS